MPRASDDIAQTAAEEQDWDKAKVIVRGQYPKIEVGSDHFWQLVMGVFKRMRRRSMGKSATESAAEGTAKFHRRLKLKLGQGPGCPACGSRKYGLMPPDFETAKCSDCGRNYNAEGAAKEEVMMGKAILAWLFGRQQSKPHVVTAMLRKAATVKNPGSRGGKFYYDEHGHVRYGDAPASDKAAFSSHEEFGDAHQSWSASRHVEQANRHIRLARTPHGTHGESVMHEALASLHLGAAERKGARMKYSQYTDSFWIVGGPASQGPQFSGHESSDLELALDEAAVVHSQPSREQSRPLAKCFATRPEGDLAIRA